MLNSVVIMGRLTADPELRQTQSGVSVTGFTVAVDRKFNNGEEKIADFFNVVAWRQTADFVTKYFRKGKMIAIQGCLQTRSYDDKDGNKRYVTEILAENVSFCGDRASNETTETKKQTASEKVKAQINLDEFEEISADLADNLPF